MYILLRIFAAMVIGGTLASGGLGFDTWQYWVILITSLIVIPLIVALEED